MNCTECTGVLSRILNRIFWGNDEQNEPSSGDEGDIEFDGRRKQDIDRIKRHDDVQIKYKSWIALTTPYALVVNTN